jgi:hypothetical protein
MESVSRRTLSLEFGMEIAAGFLAERDLFASDHGIPPSGPTNAGSVRTWPGTSVTAAARTLARRAR